MSILENSDIGTFGAANDKTVTMSRALAEVLSREYPANVTDGVTIRSIQTQQRLAREELRALLAKSDLVNHCKQCADTVQTWPESKRDCMGKLAAPVVERQEPVSAILLEDCVDISTRSYGDGYFAKPNCVRKLYTSPPAPVAVVLPRYTCIGKGGEYELLGSAIGAGTLKDMSSIPVYRDITTGQLFVRTPLDFSTRMACLDKVKEMNQ